MYSPTFPSMCLSPDQPGYGQVVSDGTGRRRARRSTQPMAPIVSAAARENRPSRTVVTGAPGGISAGTLYRPQAGLCHTPQMHPPPVPHTTWRPGSSLQTSSAASNSPTLREHNRRSSPYPKTSLHSNGSASSVTSPRDRRPRGEQSGRIPETVTLAPIQSGSQPRSFTQPPYALPPISTLEASRGGRPNNSSEVLRRLRMDDESTFDEGQHNEEQRARAHSISLSTYK
jgi:hypothetical protein